jgi:hypothetical protein
MKPKLQWPHIIEGETKPPPPGLRCPYCFNRSFKMSAVQSFEGRGTLWVCEACHFDYFESEMIDHTPTGCIAICQERELKTQERPIS